MSVATKVKKAAWYAPVEFWFKEHREALYQIGLFVGSFLATSLAIQAVRFGARKFGKKDEDEPLGAPSDDYRNEGEHRKSNKFGRRWTQKTAGPRPSKGKKVAEQYLDVDNDSQNSIDGDFEEHARTAPNFWESEKKTSLKQTGDLDDTLLNLTDDAFKEVFKSTEDKLRGKRTKREKLGTGFWRNKRVNWRKESLLGKSQLNVNRFLNRLVNMEVESPDGDTIEVNGWIQGDKLVSVWHALKFLVGQKVEGVEDRYEIHPDARFKAFNQVVNITAGGFVQRVRNGLAKPHDDLGFVKINCPVSLGQRIALEAPKNQEVYLVCLGEDADGKKVPFASHGRVVPNGEHTCATEAGDCGGVLVTDDTDPKIVGFHVAGGQIRNACVPVNEVLKAALRETSLLRLN